MKPDCELLRLYADEGDEAAFSEVVRRHLNLVYASAVRLLNGNAAMAQDVTQVVFTDLARKAGGLSQHTSVAGWLHTSVRFAAANAVRSEQRRRLREQEASAMSDLTNHNETAWLQMRPLIDEAVGQLHEPERDAVLLRFFEEKSHREVGAALGLTENAARMRVERGLEKLRAHLLRHGVTASVVFLAATLSAHAGSAPAPAALVATVAGKALVGAGLPTNSAGLAKAGLHTFWGAKAHLVLAGTAAMMSVAAAALVITQSSSGASSSSRHSLASAPSAPVVAQADVLATVQAKLANAPDVVTAATVAATATVTPSASLFQATSQTVSQATQPLVVKNSDVTSASETPPTDQSTPAQATDNPPSVSTPATEAAPVVASAAPAEALDKTATAIQWSRAMGGNGHYFLPIAEPNGISWAVAQANAAHQGGHLAIIVSRAENEFVFGLVDDPQFWKFTSSKKALLGPWLGGIHTGQASDMNYGWQWVGNAGALTFANWALLEPGAHGDRLHFFAWGNNRLSTWDNDMAQALMPGYVVEFESKPGPNLSAAEPVIIEPTVTQADSASVPRGTIVQSQSSNNQATVIRTAPPYTAPNRPLPGQQARAPLAAGNFRAPASVVVIPGHVLPAQ